MAEIPPTSSEVVLPVAPQQDAGARRAFALHPRIWQENRYVYPVVSRRSKGISIGVNLNPDKVCNFDCIYCCVDRKVPGLYKDVDLTVLREELTRMLEAVRSGAIYELDPFDKIPAELRRVNDVAFSGDGEPTSCPNFMGACKVAAEVVEGQKPGARSQKPEGKAERIKLVVITNATLFRQEKVREALAFLDQHNGEIWAKLDAGSDAYYHMVDRTTISFNRLQENLRWCTQVRPTVIQSLFMKVHGFAPPEAEIDAYGQRLAALLRAGGKIKLVQLYTVARQTTEAYATPLSEGELEGIAKRVRTAVPGVAVEVFA
jgi:wyosine [tRNA(Phe)-imidazoG37] synthetase (radical SAM superfamily)